MELTEVKSPSCRRKYSLFQFVWLTKVHIQRALKSKLYICLLVLVVIGLLLTILLDADTKLTDISIPGDVKEQDKLMYSFRKELKLESKLGQVEGNCTQTFPKCIIIGVMKGGTEAFSTFLALHPQVAMQFDVLSTRFFTRNYNQGFEWYRQMMPCAGDNQITVEKAPQYYPNNIALKRIYQFNPSIQLILMVRHPIDRAVSHFLQQQQANPQRVDGDTFEENILYENGTIKTDNVYIRQSSYIVVLQEWLFYFTLDQILIIDGDNFRRNAVAELSRTERFLNVDPYIKESMFVYNQDRNIYCVASQHKEELCLPQGKGRSHPQVHPEVYAKLEAYFEPLNQKFMEAVGMHFDW